MLFSVLVIVAYIAAHPRLVFRMGHICLGNQVLIHGT